jgi:hypothetical protein
LARQLLDGWAPAVRLDEGLRRTIDYFDTVLAGRSRASQQSHAGLEALGLSG